MPTFTFHARKPSGETVTGTQDAPDERSAAQQLHEQGYFVTELRPLRHAGASGGAPVIDVLGGASPRELAIFYRQLAVSVNAGISVGRSVELAAVGTHGRLHDALQEVTRRTGGGSTLSAALQERPTLFGRVAIALIRAGEATGKLERVLHRCASHFERMWGLQQRARSAMVYPCILLLATIVIPLLPALVTQSPAVVVRTMLVPELLHIGELILLFLGFRTLIRFERPGTIWDTIILKIPIMGRNIWKGCSARFLRTFADLYDVGVSPRESLEVAAETCGNRSMARRIVRAKPAIESGTQLSEAFGMVRVLPPLALQMLATGELSGDISESLNKVADFLESEVEASTESWMRALPVLLWLLIAIPMILQIVGMWGGYAQNLMKFSDQ